jgi:hypothetical protein
MDFLVDQSSVYALDGVVGCTKPAGAGLDRDGQIQTDLGFVRYE